MWSCEMNWEWISGPIGKLMCAEITANTVDLKSVL